MTPELRRNPGENHWHCCSNCRSWPENDYETADASLEGGGICPQCQSLIDEGRCDGTIDLPLKDYSHP